MIHILDFPDELLCKIFEYLSPFDAFYSFLNLNNRFNRLIAPFQDQIDLTYLSYDQFMYYINIILPKINQDGPLYAMKLGNKRTPGQLKLFNTLLLDENSRDYFNNIETILLESPRLDELTDFVDNFLLFASKLKTLSIQIDYIRDEHFQNLTKLIINSILSITNLVKLSIEIPSGLNLSRLSNPIIFNSLIYVNINLTLVTDLLILIQHIPNVENLLIRIGWWTSGDRTLVKMLDEMRLNSTRSSFLIKLKKFHLTISSILTFQFEHLEQVLFRILNNHQTSKFTFILQNCLNRNDELIDGQRWTNLLSKYSLLSQFNLFIRINGSVELNSFQSKFFYDKKWFFSCCKSATNNNNTIFYSIPYKNKELFDILINDNNIFNNFPINYSSNLLIEYQSNLFTFDFLPKYFPFIQELYLNHININSSLTTPINIPSLHTLRIEKERNINLPNILQLFPLINTLFISYLTIYNLNKSSE